MTCQGIRDSAHEYLTGGCEPSEDAAVKGHLKACPACTAEMERTQATLALLHTLPEIEAAPETWKTIESKILNHRFAASRFWLRTAAAASILVAVASFVILGTMPQTGALPVVAETRKALNWNESFTAAQFTTLILPDVGTLKLNQNATVRFPDARTCLLESGDLFADILPSGKGFEIRSGEATVRVHGTRFGVTAPATVYVVEGSVEVRSPRGQSLTLQPRQAAVGLALTEVNPHDYLTWLARYERPTLRLTLDPRDQTTVTPGAPLKWNLTLETDALAPLYLGARRDLSQLMCLYINDSPVPLDPNRAALKEAFSAPNGLVRLDVSHPCIIECGVDPAVFREKGTARVRAVFTSGPGAPEKAWVGILKSNEVRVEVR